MHSERPSYRSYLKGILADKTRKNPSYSLRAMARQAGCAPSTLSEVLSGKAHFSFAKIQKLASRLGLSTDETETLSLLAQLEIFDEPTLKEAALRQLQARQKNGQQIFDLGIDQFRQIADWHHSAILEMTELKDFEFSAANTARRLGIPKIEAEAAIERLVRLGLLQALPKGRYSRVPEHIRTEAHAPSDALNRFHQQMLEKTRQALAEQGPQERLSAFNTIPFRKDQLPRVREAIRRFFSEVSAISEESPANDEVFHLSLHFYNLTKQTPKKEKRK